MATDLVLPYLESDPSLSTFTGQLHGLSVRATDLGADGRTAASGTRLEDALADVAAAGRAASRGADTAVLASSAVEAARRAYARWRADAPPMSDIEDAEREVAAATEYLETLPAGAPNSAVTPGQDRLYAADEKLRELRRRRFVAGKALAEALRRAVGKLPAADRDVDGSRPRVPSGGEKMPAYPSTPRLPPRAAPPATPPSTTISSTGPSTDALAQLLAQGAKPQVQAPMMPMQQQPQMPIQPVGTMPQMPQVAPQAQPAAKSDRKRTDADDVIDDLLDDGDTPTPGLAAAVTAPRPAPAGSIAPAAPAVPQVSGYSADGMTTNAPTSGRPGATPAGAFAAPPTSLSGSHIASQQVAGSTPGAAPAAHHGAGMPTAGPIGMPASGGAGGSGSGRPPIERHSGRDHGQSAIDDAVPGGTVAQRRDRDEPRR